MRLVKKQITQAYNPPKEVWVLDAVAKKKKNIVIQKNIHF